MDCESTALPIKDRACPSFKELPAGTGRLRRDPSPNSDATRRSETGAG